MNFSTSQVPSYPRLLSHQSAIMLRGSPHRECRDRHRPARKPLGFMVLPPEIREMIYKFLLGLEDGRVRLFLSRQKLKTRDIPMFNTCILYCNKTISREAAHILYSQNSFILQLTCMSENWLHVDQWLRTIGQSNQDLLRELRLCQTLMPRRGGRIIKETSISVEKWRECSYSFAKALI